MVQWGLAPQTPLQRPSVPHPLHRHPLTLPGSAFPELRTAIPDKVIEPARQDPQVPPSRSGLNAVNDLADHDDPPSLLKAAQVTADGRNGIFITAMFADERR